MNVKQRIHRFQFYYDEPVDEKIQSIGIVDHQVFVFNGTKFLFFKRHPSQTQLMSQCTLISGLQ